MAQFFLDTATVATQTALTAHTTDSGHTWSLFAGNATSPQVYTTLGGVIGAGVSAAAVWRGSVLGSQADQAVNTEWYVGGSTLVNVAGPCARLNAAGTAGYLGAYIRSEGRWYIFRIGASLATTQLAISSTGYTYANGATVTAELRATGTGASVSLELLVNGVSLLTTTDTDAARVTASGYPGFWMSMGGVGQGWFVGRIAADDLAAAAATAVTLTGPSTSVVGSPSSNFTAGADGTITGTVTVTPSAGGGGGTFTPATVDISAGTPTATFTYTAASAGAKSISVTNNGGLTNPSAISLTATASDTAAFTAPADGRIFPLTGGATTGNAAASFAGTYTGTAPNQWRVVLDGTSTPVSGLDWAAFSSAPAAGAFSQAVTLPKGSGWYNFQVRNSGTPGTVYTSGKVGAGVLVVVDGQSQAWLWFSPTAYAGDSSLTPDPLLRVAGKQASTPNSAWDVPAAATMNAAIACGNALVSALACPVGLVDGSWDGSGLVVTGNGGQWISGGAAGNAYTSSAAAVSALVPAAIANVWIQGETDAAQNITQAAYYTGLGQLFALRRTALGQSALPYVLATLARDLTGTQTDAKREAIKAAQVQKCADANLYRVDRQDLPLHTDNIHHTAAGFTALGQRVARAILAAVGNVATYRGPRIASVAQTATPAVFDVTLTHDMGTDITPTSGITGFRAEVAGSPVTISTAARQAANVVRLTLAATPASMPVVKYLYGTAPTITGVVKDNGALTLPLEYSAGVAATEYILDLGVTGMAAMAWAATGAVDAVLGPAPMSGSVAGLATMAWAAAASVSVDTGDLPPDTVTAAVTGAATMAWAATGAVSAGEVTPLTDAEMRDMYEMVQELHAAMAGCGTKGVVLIRRR